MIPCVKWAKSGYANSIPKDYVLEEEENDDQQVPQFTPNDLESLEEDQDQYPMDIEDSDEEI